MSDIKNEDKVKLIIDQIRHDLNQRYLHRINKIVIREKRKMLDKLFEMYPYLENERNTIMEVCFKNKIDEKSEEEIYIEKDNYQLIFEQIKVNEKILYVDKYNGIWNERTELIGCFAGYDVKKEPICYFFSDNKISHDNII